MVSVLIKCCRLTAVRWRYGKMRNYKNEVILGSIAAVIIFVLGYFVHIGAAVLAMLLAVMLFYVNSNNRATVGLASLKNKKQNVIQPITFDEVGGQDHVKQELQEALDFLVNREQVAKRGIRILKGILLTGPPGTGKTLLAKAAAN